MNCSLFVTVKKFIAISLFRFYLEKKFRPSPNPLKNLRQRIFSSISTFWSPIVIMCRDFQLPTFFCLSQIQPLRFPLKKFDMAILVITLVFPIVSMLCSTVQIDLNHEPVNCKVKMDKSGKTTPTTLGTDGKTNKMQPAKSTKPRAKTLPKTCNPSLMKKPLR